MSKTWKTEKGRNLLLISLMCERMHTQESKGIMRRGRGRECKQEKVRRG